MHRSALLKDVWWHWHALKKVEIYTLGPSGLEDHMPVYRIYSTSYCDISIDHKNDIYIYIFEFISNWYNIRFMMDIQQQV